MLEVIFSNLSPGNYEITSPKSDAYNCIAWAAGDQQKWWWPDPLEETYWPTNSPRSATIEAFVDAFLSLGYQTCPDSTLEEGFEKVALYARNMQPTHAAKQLSDGRWTSKLGELEDIVHHELESLNGDIYGQPMVFLRRSAE